MKQLLRLIGVLSVCGAVGTAAFAGTETYSGKEMKQTAPAPLPECNWTGFYIGLNGGGQFGHSEDRALDGYSTADPGNKWGYDESGFVVGGQVGYNYQWNWLVLGIEADGGYMNLDGRGTSRYDRINFASDTHGETDSDFYTTIRGRLGFALGHWLFYATGGGIGVNYETRVIDDCDVFPCGDDLINAGKEEFTWGWTGGGGIEYMFNCHWTAKAEYLRYELDDQNFHAVSDDGFDAHFTGIGTSGNIIRAGLNYKF
jgi:outer membrane immunogenic protein